MGGGCRSGFAAVLALQDAGQIARRAFAMADLEEGPHDGAHHPVKEPVGDDAEAPVAGTRFSDPAGLLDRKSVV